MYIVIAGGGKVGANLTRSVLGLGHEVTLLEQRRERFEVLEEEFEHRVQLGDATELFVLERAGLARPPDLVVAVTGDDEDNMIICQIAKDKYGVEKVIARVNDPRNQPHFDLLRITLPAGSRLITIMREGQAQMADGSTELKAGDQVLAVLEVGKEDELKDVLLKNR